MIQQPYKMFRRIERMVCLLQKCLSIRPSNDGNPQVRPQFYQKRTLRCKQISPVTTQIRLKRFRETTSQAILRNGYSFASRHSSSQAIWMASSFGSVEAFGSSRKSGKAQTQACRSVKRTFSGSRSGNFSWRRTPKSSASVHFNVCGILRNLSKTQHVDSHSRDRSSPMSKVKALPHHTYFVRVRFRCTPHKNRYLCNRI